MDEKYSNLWDIEEDWYEDITRRDADEQDEKKRFTIDSDNLAEWAVRKIAETEADYNRLIKCCADQIAHYEAKAAALRERCDKQTMFLKSHLASYFETVKHKTTDTQESYSLPSGKLVLKHHEPKITRDDARLADWCMWRTGMDEYVGYEPRVEWGKLKKTLTLTESGFCTADGEIVPGVDVEAQPDTFEVKIGG